VRTITRIVSRMLWTGVWLGCSIIVSGQQFTLTDYPVPIGNAFVGAITTGPDGALWFTDYPASQIGRITTNGVVSFYPISISGSQPEGIVSGPDGALWFTDAGSNSIGRLTTAGVVTEYPVPTATSGSGGIASGPGGALWFTEAYANKIGRITTQGAVTEYPVPTANSHLAGIIAGPDGALWFTEAGSLSNTEVANIGRISTAGAITEYPVTAMYSDGCSCTGPVDITSGPDGALWFTQGYSIGRITTSGAVTYYNLPPPSPQPIPFVPDETLAITTGPDGALWFTALPIGLGRITTAGFITGQSSYLGNNITLGPDGALWLTPFGGSDIARLGPSSILNGGIVNAASFAVANGAGAPVAPGSLVAIFTSNLAAQGVSFTGTSLPDSLGGVSVTLNGIPAPIVQVVPAGANSFVSAQVPFEVLPAGVASGTASVVLTVDNTPSAPVQASIVPSAPGIFT